MNILNDIEDVLLDLDFIDPPRGYRNQKIEYKIFEDKVSIYGSRKLYFLKKDVNDIVDRIKDILVDDGYTVNIQNVDSDSHYMRYHDDDDAKWHTIVKGVNIHFSKANESLKYLMLFESFRDDLYKSKKELDERYEKENKDLIDNTKSVVDEFMFDLTDDYPSVEPNTAKYGVNGILYLSYHLKCDIKDLDKLLNTVSEVEERISDELGLRMSIKGCSELTEYPDTHHDLNHGTMSKLSELLKYIDMMKKMKDFASEYSSFSFKILIY